MPSSDDDVKRTNGSSFLPGTSNLGPARDLVLAQVTVAVPVLDSIAAQVLNIYLSSLDGHAVTGCGDINR